MIFDILTLFPEACEPYLDASILGRAREAGLIEVRLTNIRDHALDRHHTVDDTPYGGGSGMVMRADVLARAVESLPPEPPGRVILLTPQGRPLDQAAVCRLAGLPRLILCCGRYEGVDDRFVELLVDEEISLGDFVLSGGELAALCVVEAVSRLLPGVLGAGDSAEKDSFSGGLLEHPHYTRPAEFRGLTVPEVLTGGHHARIEQWRREKALERTLRRRPELLAGAPLSQSDREVLTKLGYDGDI